MRRTYYQGLIASLIVLVGCAVHGQTIAVPDNHPAGIAPFPHRKWTVLIYMSADNELDHYAMNNIHEMESVAPMQDAAQPGITILVQLDRSSDNTAPESWKDTRRYHIVRDPVMSEQYLRVKDQAPPTIPETEHPNSPAYKLPGRIFHTLSLDATVPIMPDSTKDGILSPRLDNPPLGKLDMGNPKTLNDFIRWGQRIAPADHYLVYTWGHGCGWTLDDDELRGGKAKSFCEDDGFDPDGTSINSAEISKALVGVHHVDVLAMDNCMMAMFEVAYQLRRQVDYLTASEEEIPDRGFDYHDVLDTLTKQHGNISPARVAQLIARDNLSAWQHFGFGNTLTNSVVLPNRTIKAARTLSILSRRLIAVHARYRKGLQRARTECIQFGMVTDYIEPSNIVDVCDYLQRLILYVPDHIVRQQARAAELAVQACITADYTSRPYDFARGLSIYLPAAKEMTHNYISTYAAFAFCHDTAWLQWLMYSP